MRLFRYEDSFDGMETQRWSILNWVWEAIRRLLSSTRLEDDKRQFACHLCLYQYRRGLYSTRYYKTICWHSERYRYYFARYCISKVRTLRKAPSNRRFSSTYNSFKNVSMAHYCAYFTIDTKGGKIKVEVEIIGALQYAICTIWIYQPDGSRRL